MSGRRLKVLLPGINPYSATTENNLDFWNNRTLHVGYHTLDECCFSPVVSRVMTPVSSRGLKTSIRFHKYQIKIVSLIGLIWFACPVTFLCTTPCASSVRIMICKPCCKQQTYCQQEDETGWNSWLPSDCIVDLKDRLHNLPSTKACAHTYHINKTTY